ncbi:MULTISPECIES: group 1 truncated hemoglobin [unclassified Novosphingobium]|uniref:group 1 truncated hemoglobin n=1 Tax=unclassified Novosphingobium TaxID=2644732 RepID=UPI000F5DD04F|nr:MULTISPECIES: group 1 truncated hemoglobin [unclassified Novosphingobium]MBF5092884.1 group 1 truncated hemoglobin [Novosphingobium sp. NBM11]RQW44770.1 group 1 truncated hemoglobin [Novosphingobium sp. LASN5T]
MAEELPVDPYPQSDANAGAKPFAGEGMARALGGQAGIRRITARFVELNVADPRIKAIFAEHDLVRLQRTLVENLQRAMREAHVSFAAQNRVLAKLAPMDRDVTER